MHKWFATYFGFSRRELNGVCVLAFILLLLWGIPRVFSFRTGEAHEDIAVQIAEIERFVATAKEPKPANDGYEYGSGDRYEVPAPEVTYFMFDPNGLPVVDWKRLGLSDRQIRMIKNYEAKGGRFRKKEDLARIYAIDDADYARLEPYIEIKRVKSTQPDKQVPQYIDPIAEPTEPKTLHIDLNEADSLELQYLPGIGPVFASRIVRFRESLGGFHHVSQLMDVYGFDSVRFAGLAKQV